MGNKVKAIVRKTLAGSSLTGSYQAINPNGLDAACFEISLANTTGAVVDVSYDGSTDNDVITAGGTLKVEAQTNNQPAGHVALFAKGQVVYVKGTMGSGNVYLSGYYVSQ